MGVVILEKIPDVKKRETIENRLYDDLTEIWNSNADFAELTNYNSNAYTMCVFMYVRDKIVIEKVVEEMENRLYSDTRKNIIVSYLRLPTTDLSIVMDSRMCNTKYEKHMWVIINRENINKLLDRVTI